MKNSWKKSCKKVLQGRLAPRKRKSRKQKCELLIDTKELNKSQESKFQDALNDISSSTMQPGNEQQDDSNVNNSSGNPREGRQQQPPSTLNLGTNNNNHLESVQSNSSANNSPFIKDPLDSLGDAFPVVGESRKQHEKEKRSSSRKKKRASQSWYNVLSSSYRSKNDQFHKCFKEIPDHERLLYDASCALVRDDIKLLQGRLYVSQNYICFYSNLFKKSQVMIRFEECTNVKKEKLAKIFSNSISFQTEKQGKQLFASFTSRDRCFAFINRTWEMTKNQTPMSPQQMWDNVREQYGSDLGCSSDSDYVKADSADESQKRKKKNSKKKAKSSEPPSTFSVSNSYQSVTTVDATTPVVPTTPLESPNNNTVFGNDWKEASADETSMVSEDRISNSNSFVGSFSTDFVDTDPTPSSHILENLRHTCMDEQYAISATEIFNVIFGDNSNFYRDYLAQKNCEDTIYGKWNPPADDGNRHRINDYVMPLTNPLGPKSSRIVEDQTLYKESDLGKTYGIDIVTQNYNIPYSEYFQTIVRYSICKTGVRSSELKVSAEVRFLKKPWGMVKTFIENNAYSGIADNFNKMKIELADFVSQNFSQKKSDETTTTTAAAATEQQQSRSNAVNSENSAATVAGDHDTTTTTVRQRRGTNEGDSGKARAFSNHHVTSPRGPVASLAEGESAGGTIGNIVESVVSGFTSVCTNTSTYTKMLALFIVVLLYSNYSMHQRLVTLEKVMETESVRSDDAPSSTHQFPTADSKEWKMLENLLGVVLKRIEQLEATFKEHIQMESKWLNEQRSSWNVFENKVTTALENRDNL